MSKNKSTLESVLFFVFFYEKCAFFFQAKKKEAKKSPGHLRLCPGLKAPGRNYKLLPALATNSPPDCLRSASRPQRFGGVERQDALRCSALMCK